jgi:hypothetical protein
MIRQLLALGLIISFVAVVGCGGGMVPIKGEVLLDGKPIAGATVTFFPQAGGQSGTGVTDSSGVFSIYTGNKAGVPAGSYKVTVTKTGGAVAPADMTPGSPEYMKMMAKSGGPKTGPGATASTSTNQLPDKYSTPEKTPLSVTIPSSSPIKLELSSK